MVRVQFNMEVFMANVNRLNGFTPVKHMNGAPYNGQANLYEVAAGYAVNVFVGDLVKLSTEASTSGLATVEALGASAAGAIAAVNVVGAVVGIVPAKLDADGGLTRGSTALDTPQFGAASTKRFVLVADSPDLIFETQFGTAVALADIGLNASINVGTHNTTSGASAYSGVTPAATATLPLQIMGASKRVDNETAATNNKMLVRINTHQYKAAGVLGI